MTRRAWGWTAAAAVAAGAWLYGAVAPGPPRTNADRVHALARGFACPVCAGQSVAESDVPVAREIRRQIGIWVDEGRSDRYIRDELVAAYDIDIDYNPSGAGLTGLVWVLPVAAGVGAAGVLIVIFHRRRTAAVAAAAEPGDATAGLAIGRADRPGKAVETIIADDEPPVGRPGRRRGLATDAVETIIAAADPPVPAETAAAAAAVAPAVEPPAAPSRSRFGLAVTAAVIAVAAVVAGVLVARYSGSRAAGDSITGEIRRTSRELLFEAQQTVVAGDIAAAIAVYDEVLELQPSNVEALTYRGWLTARSGDLDRAAAYLEEAIATDSDYPDAHLFRSLVALDQGEIERAEAELAIFDASDPPPFARSLIESSQLRPRIRRAQQEAALAAVEAERAAAGADGAEPVAFSATSLTVGQVALAAEQLATEGRLLDAVRLFDWALESRPGDPEALTGRGWLVARTGDPELLAVGIAHLDRALELDPAYPFALVYRAFARHQQGDPEAARADLAAFDAGENQPAELVRLIDDFNLRQALS